MSRQNPSPARPARTAAIARVALAGLGLAASLTAAAASTTTAGRLAGSGSVDAAGAASWSLPIAVSPGINGLAPALAISYRSHAGDGEAGAGADLTGLSRVTRCPRIMATDARVRGVRFDGDDRFCLDGQVLVLVSGTHGGDGAEYRTETDQFERVWSRGRLGSGPAWFEVRQPGGTTRYYGVAPEARTLAAGTPGEVREWALSSVTDRFRNQALYSYLNAAGLPEALPVEIRWSTDASGNGARFRLRFEYTLAEDRERRGGFTWGSRWDRRYRVREVRYESDEGSGFGLVHRYTLAYGTGPTGRARLQSIEQCGPDACLPPTSFTWQDGAPGFATAINGPGDATAGDALLTDIDGDGATDLLIPVLGNGTRRWYLRRTDPASPGLLGTTLRDTGVTSNGAGHVLDFDGDGRRDLLVMGTGTPATWWVYRSSGTGFLAGINTGIAAGPFATAAPADIDGDGREDIVYLRDQQAWFRRSLGTGVGPEQPTPISAGGEAPPVLVVSGMLPPVDFDGDGRSDLLVRRQATLMATTPPYYEGYLSTGTGLERSFSTAAAGTVLPLDVNGDGLTDLLIRDQASFGWQVRISLGTTLAEPVPAGLNGNPATVRVLDYDGDGRDDLLRAVGTTGWRVHLADDAAATPYSDTDATRYIDISGSPTPAQAGIIVTDLTGDGRTDLLFARAQPRRWEVQVRAGQRPDLLSSVTDGLGMRWELTHRPLSAAPGYSAPGADRADDRLLRGGGLPVVTAMTESDGAGGTWTTTFRYTNGRVSRVGRGFLGFEVRRATDSRYAALHGVEVHSDTTFRQDFPFIGAVAGGVTARADGHRIRTVDTTWARHARPATADPAADTHFVYPTREVTVEYETDPDGGALGQQVRRVERAMTWDHDHGAVARETVTTSSPDHPEAQAAVTVRSFDESARQGGGCLGLVTREEVTEATSAGESATRTSTATWSAATCRQLSVTTGPAADPARQLVTSFGYDAAGRLASVERRPADGSLPARRTVFVHAPGTERPLAEVALVQNQAGHSTQHTWHYGLDRELSRTDPRGLTGTWRWDNFARLVRESQPDASGGGTRTNYLPCHGSCMVTSGAYQILTLRDDGFWTMTVHDGTGRVVAREVALAGGRSSRQLTEYDALGRVRRESMPFIVGEPTYWVETAYEPGGRPRSEDRPVSATQPDGARTRWSYARLATTTTDAENRVVTRVTDAKERLVRVSSAAGGTTAYGYTPFGEVARITDANGITTTLAYDERGLPTTVDSPDAGRRTSTWNAFGELASQADAASPPRVITYAWDQLGRLASRTDGAGTATWQYGTDPDTSFGQLLRQSAPAGPGVAAFTEAYTYDNRGRRNHVITTIDGSTYVTDMTWDPLGRLVGITYPGTVNGARPRFRYRYEGAGYLDAVEQDVSGTGGLWVPLYDLQAHDAVGRAVHVLLGNAATIDQRAIIDPATLRPAAIRTGRDQGGERQDLAYRWDRVGNLLERADRNLGTVEEFSFDELDRLTAARLNGAQTLAITWDAGSRIRWKSDVGNYTYGSARPSAVASVSGGPRGSQAFSYDANGQMVARNGRPITWTAFNQPLRIDYGSGDHAEFGYGPDRQRVRQVARTGGSVVTTHYVGPHFEVEIRGTSQRYRSSVFANGEAFYTQVEQDTPASLEGYFIHRDHQGSVDTLTRVVGTGGDTLRQSFDAFGKRRNANWTADTADQRYADPHFTERGYTGHEHLDNVRLIHMNGRLQDPLLGVMLSPDPVLGSLADPRTLNRYGYAGGNPVSATDPDGFFLKRLFKNILRAIRHLGSFIGRVVERYGRNLLGFVVGNYVGGWVSDWYLAKAPLTVDGIKTAEMLGGMAAGATTAAIARGEPRAIVGGAISGGVMKGVELHFGNNWTLKRIIVTSTVGGAMAYVETGNFAPALGTLATTATTRYLYNRVVGYDTTWKPGGEAQPKGRYQGPVEGANNFGNAQSVVDPGDFFGEGGQLSRLMNRVPGVNAVAGFHDVMQVGWDRWGGAGLRSWLNVPGMPVAAAVTYPALLDGVPALQAAAGD
jgi:RHS repeat-associated protein